MRAIVSSLFVAAFTLATLPAAQAQSQIAVIDVAKIFKEDPSIESQVESIKKQVDAQKDALKQQQQVLVTESKKLKNFKPGTPEYAQQEEVVANMESKMRLEMARKRKELADQEAKIYFGNYQRIVEMVGRIAKSNKIMIVLRYNSEDMDQEKGDTIVRGVMKNVVYHDQGIDITPMVQNMLRQVAKR